jgi:hypothetical protein
VLQQIEVASDAGFGAIELWFADMDAHLDGGGATTARSPTTRNWRGLSNLRNLDLGDNPIPYDQKAMLKKALPDCKT